jgi:hypothetical protein
MVETSGASPGRITVSVVLSTYNRARYLPDALDSLLDQTRPPDEIIVVNDGSTDNTNDVAVRYRGRVRYFRQPRNCGKSVALNYAIPLAQGSHICIFDDDDVALPDAIQSHVDALECHPEAVFSYSTNYVFAGNGDIWDRSKWKLRRLPPWTNQEFFLQQAMKMTTTLQGMLIPKLCFQDVGYFDVRLLRCQDLDMLLRLARNFVALDLQKPTFVLRDHDGPRGPERELHAEAQRTVVWLRHERTILREMRDRYPLSAYLPHVPGTEIQAMSAAQSGQALLQRGAMMLQKGLMHEALSDIQAGLTMLDETEQNEARLKSILSDAFDVDMWKLSKPYDFTRRVTHCLDRDELIALRPAVSRGLYWALTRSIHRHRWHDALRSAVMLMISLLPNPRLSTRPPITQ